MFSSLRLKIVLWYSAVVLVTLIIVRLVSTQLIQYSLYNELDDSLLAEAQWIRSILTVYKSRGISDDEIREDIETRSSLNPRKEFIEIYESSGRLYFSSPNLEHDRLRGMRNHWTAAWCSVLVGT